MLKGGGCAACGVAGFQSPCRKRHTGNPKPKPLFCMNNQRRFRDIFHISAERNLLIVPALSTIASIKKRRKGVVHYPEWLRDWARRRHSNLSFMLALPEPARTMLVLTPTRLCRER